MNDNWNHEELRASVEAYLSMQTKVLGGEKIIKKDYYRELSAKFNRTEKAFEYRMQNISYVLSLKGRQWIQGLNPAKNVGANVAIEIESILAEIENREKSPELEFEARVQAALSKGSIEKPQGNKSPKANRNQSNQFERDPKVKAWVLITANGCCELCTKAAPFISVTGFPFLEVHHVKQLADGGSDTVENAIALCPNCHREFHHGRNSRALIERAYESIKRLSRE
jgi:5-methylcytosine-specific restriction protein A